MLKHETVKYLGTEAVVERRYDTTLLHVETAARGLLRIRIGSSLTVAAVFGLSLGCVGSEVLASTMTVGDFTLIGAYIVRLAQPLEALGFAARDLSQGIGFLEKMLQLMDEPAETSAHREGRAPDPRGALLVERVHFSYRPGHPVLQDVSFCASPGQTIGQERLRKVLAVSYSVSPL